MQFITVEIKKRNVVRTLRVPDFTNSYGRDIPSAKHVRFYVDRTEYVRGQMRIVFDLDGRAVEGWSYYTCMYCFAEPSEDFAQGRLIDNASGYGSTTGKHRNEMFWYFYGDQRVQITRAHYGRVQKTVGMYRFRAYDGTTHVQPITRDTRAYYKTIEHETVNAQWHFRAEQICWGRGATPDDMRREYATMERHRPYADIYAERQAHYAAMYGIAV